MKNSYSETEWIQPLPIHIMLITNNRYLLSNPLACITLLHTQRERERVEEEDKEMVPNFNDKYDKVGKKEIEADSPQGELSG